ncbi:MAG: serine hydrolase domain-containing protein [Nitriliruptoraceae bacterium]
MRDLDAVLATTGHWAPDTVAIGVTNADQTMATHGPVDLELPLASLSKPLTAYAVLVGVQQGLLSLDEPFGPADGATVRHLLAHAGGVPLDEGMPINTPERRRMYSNWAFELLGALVADRSDTPFADFLALEVLDPLGMSATSIDGSPARDGRGTVTDLLTFARELLAPHLLDKGLHAEATSIAFAGLDGVLPGHGRQRPNDWGLGFEIRGRKDPHWLGTSVSVTTFGHFGQSGGFLWVDPELGIACAELADQPFGDWTAEVWPDLSDEIVAAVR